MSRISAADAARLGIAPALKGKRGPNKTELRYGAYLATLKAAGEIVDYGFEEIKLKIGVRTCYYVPDFWVLTTSGLSFHEVKGGFFRDDAKVKIKAAALKFPRFRFVLVRANSNGWTTEIIE